jgi:hypothetical protein
MTAPLALTMAALMLATVGIYAAIGTFWSFPTAILIGTGAAAGIALVNSIGNLGGLVGPVIVGVMRETAGDFTAALFFLSGALVLAGIIALISVTANARADASPKASYDLAMNHVVLLGDSIFDNKAYVGNGPDVVEQLSDMLPSGWHASLLAVDGASTHDVKYQLERLPPDATHVVVSAGGNDALGHADMLQEWTWSAARVLDRLADIRDGFQKDYRAMLDGILARKLPTAVCTIYDARFDDPDMRRIANTALTVFNDVITREAFARGLPLIDLRLIFSDDADYANPIEPSVQGGAKIARAITTLLATHDFISPRTEIYVA